MHFTLVFQVVNWLAESMAANAKIFFRTLKCNVMCLLYFFLFVCSFSFSFSFCFCVVCILSTRAHQPTHTHTKRKNKPSKNEIAFSFRNFHHESDCNVELCKIEKQNCSFVVFITCCSNSFCPPRILHAWRHF